VSLLIKMIFFAMVVSFFIFSLSYRMNVRRILETQ